MLWPPFLGHGWDVAQPASLNQSDQCVTRLSRSRCLTYRRSWPIWSAFNSSPEAAQAKFASCGRVMQNDVWTYRPESHKNEHHGRDRVSFIGPKAQDVLRPYLLREKTVYCFAPAESEQKRNAAKRESRKSPMTPSQSQRRKRNPRHTPGDQYCTASYRRAITRAVEKANK
jgi:hypothetical protein